MPRSSVTRTSVIRAALIVNPEPDYEKLAGAFFELARLILEGRIEILALDHLLDCGWITLQLPTNLRVVGTTFEELSSFRFLSCCLIVCLITTPAAARCCDTV